jgi:glycosyltransferase involved in cell wall biosynthesis
MSIKIAIVSNTSWSVYNFRLGLIRDWRQKGIEVIVIAPKDGFSAKLISEGFTYEHVALDNYGVNPFQELLTIRALRQIYKRHKVDFVFHYTIKPNIYGTIAARLCGIPSIAVTTGLGHLFTFKNGMVHLATLSLYRFAAWLSKEVWFLNEDDLQIFLQKRVVSPQKTHLLPSEGINTEWFAPLDFEVAQPKEKTVFLFAGRLLKDKGVVELAEAAAAIRKRYPSAEFRLLGFIDPTNPNSVTAEQIHRWQQHDILRYMGETTDVRKAIDECDCLVFPSYYREGISRILLEAASMGKPIITSDNVGCREVVEHEYNGFLCRPRDSQDLANVIQRFLSLSPQERQKMGQNGRAKVMEAFDEKIILQHYWRTITHYLQLPSTTPPNVTAKAPSK